MLIARPLSALAGLSILVLLSRSLPSTAYGIYFAVWAMAEIIILASNFGLLNAAYRYVHADERQSGLIVPYGPVWRLILLRVLSLVVGIGILFIASFPLDKFIELKTVSINVSAILALIVIGEGMARFVEVNMDSMLCQGRSQASLVSRTLLRFLGIAYLAVVKDLSIESVMIVEVIAIWIGLLISLMLLGDIYRRANQDKAVFEQHEQVSTRRMIQYAFPAFVAQVLTLVYGADALKLVLSNVSGAEALAVFGFAYSLSAVIQRYIPANLLAGIFRPVFVAASKRPDADTVLPDLLSLSIKINWLIILPIVCAGWFGANTFLSIVSGGNYANAGLPFVLLAVTLMPISVHLILNMYSLAKEVSWPMIFATLLSTSSLLLGFYLGTEYGVLGISVTFLIGEIIWSISCYFLLRKYTSGNLSFHWIGLLKLILAAVFAIMLCQLISMIQDNWIFLSISAGVAYLFFAWILSPLTKQETTWLNNLMPEKLKKLVSFK